MLDDMFVIDSVVHPFDMRTENLVGEPGEGLRNDMWALHTNWSPPDAQVTQDVYYSDWSPEQLTHTLFRESSVDIAVNHHLPLYSWFHDGWVGAHKNIELAERWPDRYLLYAGVDPTQGTSACLASLERQVADCPSRFVGLKLYPAQVSPYRHFRLDDLELMTPLYERILELGISTVAVHKAAPMGPLPSAPYRVDDVEGAAMCFPDLNFEIVHSGLAFVEECALAAGRFPNVYLNLETTFMLATHAPGWFEELIAFFAVWSGFEKLLFSSAVLQAHPQPLLETFRDFRFSDATLEKYGLAQIRDDDKRKVLGLNHARLLNLDVEQARARIADDAFSRHQAERGLDAPFSNWTASATRAAT
jgi:predicted TIM-barrel fold metal-dependent hydrolase